MHFKKNKKGFTLMELVVVVLLIGILSAVALPQYQRALERSRISEALTMLGNISTAERMYFMQTDEFTTNFADLMLKIPVKPKAGDDASNYSNGTGQAFDYDISACEDQDCNIKAVRTTGKYEIHLDGLSNEGESGTRSCHSDDSFGIKICRIVCGANPMPDGGGFCVMD